MGRHGASGRWAALLLAAATAWPLPGAAQTGSGGRNLPEHLDAPYVVLISFDGFRHDYLDRGITPHFERLAEQGVRADALIPVYPTKTYPNHYSIATGLYSDRHGIASNTFYDPDFDAVYSISDRSTVEDGRWYGGEPIWVAAERQGMVAAAMFFIGTEAPVRGVQPTHWNRYDHQLPDEHRIRTIVSWLSLPPAERPHMITGYFALIDDAGHFHGPDSPELNRALVRADSLLGDLMRGIEELPHGERVHLVVVSDHGMTAAREWIYLDRYVDLDGVVAIDSGPFVALWFHGDTARMNHVQQRLRTVPHLSAYERAELPSSYRAAGSSRTGDLVVIADEHYQVATRPHTVPPRAVATHGYPPIRSMYGIFLAAGPRVRQGARVPAFENVHIHTFLAELLGIEPARDIDGTLDVLRHVLREDS